MQFKLASSLMLAVAATSVLADSSTESQEPVRIVIKLNAYGFQPSNVKAKVGDSIEFHFGEGTSSVVQSDFATPCKAMKNGFSSGTFIVDTTMDHNNEGPHIFVVPVTSTNPVAFYNGIKSQCYGYGAVGVINGQEDTEQSQDKLKAKAFASHGISENPNLVRGGIIEANPEYDDIE
ncbi:hypothetical protein Cpir12675_001598 [Ceratocystis pirilliformis]|uniref:Extracellular serine-rich protein n=1 Tax=Ceratocystis pirilliformis TaxID=259994 RepID=A0ABR3ZFN9_9PEZI